MKKVIAMFLATVMCAMTLSGCGSETTNDNAGAAGTEANVAEGNAEGDNVLVVGTNAEFPPFEYIGDNGEPDGFDIALIKAIGEKLGMEVRIENMEFASLVAAIGSRLDASIAGMTITPEREEAVDFSDSYYEAVQSVIVKEGSEIATAEDLKNKVIGVQAGTTGFFIADEIEGADVRSYNKGVDAVNDLLNGRVDLVIIDRNPAEVFVSKNEGLVALEGAQFEFEPENYAIALPKGSELVEKVNTALKELKEDGTFDALVKQYIEGTE